MSEPAAPEGPAAPALVEVELAGIGTVRLPADRTLVSEEAPADSNHQIASARFTVGEGDDQLTIQAEGTTGRIGITDEATARTIGRILTRGGEVQTVTALDSGNFEFEIYAIRDSEEHYILVGNDDQYLKCSTTDAARVTLRRPGGLINRPW